MTPALAEPLAPVVVNGPTLSTLVTELVWIERSPFSFSGREFQLPVYDEKCQRILLKWSRQTEKTEVETCKVLMSDGERRQIKDVYVGDRVATLLNDGSHVSIGQVTWKSRRYQKRCLRITTGLNHTIEVGITHPIRQWDRWTPAASLAVGDRVATVRKIETECDPAPPCDNDTISFIGYMIGDGYLGHKNRISFNQDHTTPVTAHFRSICAAKSWNYREYPREGTDAHTFVFRTAQDSPVPMLASLGLVGLNSQTVGIPDALMRMPLDQTKILIEALWATDGCILTHRASNYELTYASISETLAKQMQVMLWKFGIPTRVRQQKPQVYAGTGKTVYLVTVRTGLGIATFLRTFNVLGKPGTPPAADPNDNRDTYPLEIRETLRAIFDSKKSAIRHEKTSLRSAGHRGLARNKKKGLLRTPQYAPSRRRLREYVDVFRADPEYDQTLVEKLAAHIDTDIYWDTITSIEDIGEQWCYDISVADTGNFITEGVITHNSTSLAIREALLGAYYDGLKILHVAPRDEQVRAFSKKRFEKVVMTSPRLKWLLEGPDVLNNQKDKVTVTGTEYTFRSAFRDADSVRGYSADALFLDEYQDLVRDHIQVIEECQSHATRRRQDGSIIKMRVYAGTPKTFDNPLEERWKGSTQYCWVVFCHHCSHYNEQIGIQNMGPTYLKCAKCDKQVFPKNGFWVCYGKQDAEWAGYHLNALVYEHCDWVDTWNKLEGPHAYTERVFRNEVLGESFDSGAKVVTADEVRACCDETRPNIWSRAGGVDVIYGGIDWGGVGNSTTVFVAGCYISDKFVVLGARRWDGRDPGREVEEIAAMATRMGCKYLAADLGGGARLNQELAERMPKDVKVVQFHNNDQIGTIVRWHPRGDMYVLSKPRSIGRLLHRIKRKHDISFFKWDHFHDFAADITCIYEEWSPHTRSVSYDHPSSQPDDFVHALNLAAVTADIRTHRIKPLTDENIGSGAAA